MLAGSADAGPSSSTQYDPHISQQQKNEEREMEELRRQYAHYPEAVRASMGLS